MFVWFLIFSFPHYGFENYVASRFLLLYYSLLKVCYRHEVLLGLISSRFCCRCCCCLKNLMTDRKHYLSIFLIRLTVLVFMVVTYSVLVLYIRTLRSSSDQIASTGSSFSIRVQRNLHSSFRSIGSDRIAKRVVLTIYTSTVSFARSVSDPMAIQPEVSSSGAALSLSLSL